MKVIEQNGIARFVKTLVTKIKNGAWLPVSAGSGEYAVAESYGVAEGNYSHAEGYETESSGEKSHAEGNGAIASGVESHAEGYQSEASGEDSHAEGIITEAKGYASHSEGISTTAIGRSSHAEGKNTTVIGNFSHAQGSYNYDNASFIDMVGIGNSNSRKNASAIYVGRTSDGDINSTNPKNGYQYLIGVGGYKGQAVTAGIKSVQEVIDDFEARISALESQI